MDLRGVRVSTLEFVVARYDEDVSWLAAWAPRATRITVYDKSGGADDALRRLADARPNVRVVRLPNVGREAHTYAHHIVQHHADLCDTVVFTQGSYAEHISDADFAAMVSAGRRPHFPLDVPWTSSLMSHWGWTPAANWASSRGQAMLPTHMTMAEFFHAYVAADAPPNDLGWWPGAVFAAQGACIARRPVATFAALRDLLAQSPNPEAAHCMERLWKALVD